VQSVARGVSQQELQVCGDRHRCRAGTGLRLVQGQFWALYFLQTVKKLDVLTSSYIVGIALLIATPTLIFWGWLSDKIGRKPIILGGMALASITY
jgi:MFS family permease